jgi:hypothetical protein
MLDDTTADALAVQLQVLRRIGVAGRAAMTFELSDNLRQIVKDGVRCRHPDWDETQIKHETFRIVYGERLYNEVFGQQTKTEREPCDSES